MTAVLPQTTRASAVNAAAVIPTPAHLELLGQPFRLCAQTTIVINDPALQTSANYFAQFLAPATGFALQIETASEIKQGAINLQLTSRMTATEAYSLVVSCDHILLSAASTPGIFWGLQTIRQLMPEQTESALLQQGIDWTVTGVNVSDSPRFAYRGMHLDVSRHYFPLEFIKRYLDWMALHKLNMFHWHLTDDQGWRMEIRQLPRLCEIGGWRKETVAGHALDRDATTDGIRHGGYYSQDEIRELVQYAAERCITVIPEIDMPGHSSALLAAYPECGCRKNDYEVKTHFGIFAGVLCPSSQTFEYLNIILNEMADLFPGPFIHVGGDEVVTTAWQQCVDCKALMQEQGFTHVDQLQKYFFDELSDMVARVGKKNIAWDDILDFEPDGQATMMAWRGDQRVVAAARQGHDVVLLPRDFYFDSYQSKSLDEPLAIHGLSSVRDVYETALLPPELEPQHESRILGAQGALWTEYVATEAAAEYAVLPRMCALAEQVWSPDARRSWADFSQRMHDHFRRIDAMQLNACRSITNVQASTSIQHDRSIEVVLWTDVDCQAIRYTLDGSQPSRNSAQYVKPIIIPERALVRAVAEDKFDGTLRGELQLCVDRHLAVGCPVQFTNPADDSWGNEAERLVVDGVRKRAGFFLHQEWAGFVEQDMVAEIDLEAIRPVREVEVGFAAKLHRRLYPPTGLEVYVSVDGVAWHRVVASGVLHIPDGTLELKASFDTTPTRYLRVHCENQFRAYSHEKGAMERVTIYIDQIAVR